MTYKDLKVVLEQQKGKGMDAEVMLYDASNDIFRTVQGISKATDNEDEGVVEGQIVIIY
jgi:hypothetical protein